MPTIPVYLGTKRGGYGWGDDTSCLAVEFLLKLEAEGKRDSAILWKLIRMAGDDQPSRNREKCHQLEGSECKKLFEFKAGGGSRLVWFYGKDGDIILTHGVKKPKNNGAVVREQCAPVQLIRMQYLGENNL